MNVNVKWSRYRPAVAQRVGRGIALLFHDRGTRRGLVVSSTPRPHFTPGKVPVPILQEAGWVPEPVWTDGESRSHLHSIPDRPALRSLAIPSELIGPQNNSFICHNFVAVMVVFAGPSRRDVKDVGLRPLDCWDRGFESHQRSAFLSVVSVVGCQRSLRRADHSSKGVLPIAVRRCVWSRNLVNEEVLAHWGLLRPKQTKWWYLMSN